MVVDKPKSAPSPEQRLLDQRVHVEEQHAFERVFYAAVIGLWLVAVLTATLVWLVEPSKRTTALGWLLAGTVVLSATILAWLWVQKQDLSPRQKDIYYGVMAVPNGLVWVAAALLLYDPQQPLVTLFLVCMLAGAGAGAVSALAALPHLYWLLMVPAFAAQSATYAWRGNDAFHALLAVAMMVLLVANLIFVRAANRTVKKSISLAFENTDLVAQLREQTAAALDASNAKTKFLAAASHDLRQPVHALMLFVEVLGNTKLDPHQRGVLGHIRAASQASAELLTTLLDFSRIEAGVMQPKPQAVALAPLLRELEDEFGPQADSKQLVYRTRDTEAIAYCDKSLVALILRNFVSNAVRYTNQGGVLIGVRAQGDALQIQVCDTGIGIAAHHYDDIFKEFHQLGNDERDRQKGLGLGLAIAKGLAASLGTRITLNSRLGRGSVFTLWLPKAQLKTQTQTQTQPQPQPQFQAQSQPSLGLATADFDNPLVATASAASAEGPFAAAPSRGLRGLQVLVVDDDAAVRLSMTSLLQSWGCTVRAVEGLDDAVLLAREQTPQLLVTDYRLRNGCTGGDVITSLREQCGSALAAVIITGDTDPARLREAASYRATLLHKPVSAVSLREALVELASTVDPRRGM